MEKIKVSFAIRNGVLNVCASLNGKRDYRVVKGLINPNLDKFDKSDGKKWMFADLAKDSIHNNIVLLETLERCQKIIEARNPATGKELLDLYSNGGVEACKSETLGIFLQSCIDDMRTGKDNRLPSRNYQNYIALLNKLKAEGTILNIPLSDINDSHFIRFSNYINSLPWNKGKSNYSNIMMEFKAVHGWAVERGKNKNTLVFPYGKNAPKKAAKKRFALTQEQYKAFCNLDLSLIPLPCVNSDYYKELYRDFVMFMYEMFMRPCDVISLHTDQIHVTENGAYIEYKVEKNKSKNDKLTITPITDKARQIIDKYAGKSLGGYVFPFSMNNTKWDKTNHESFHKWDNKRSKTEEKIRSFIKKTAEYIGVDPKGFVEYTFRHSTITHAVLNGADPFILSKIAGTSAGVIDNHYTNDLIKQLYNL
jgi:integrase